MKKEEINAFISDLESLLLKHMPNPEEECWKMIIVEGKLWEATHYSCESVELWKEAHCNVP